MINSVSGHFVRIERNNSLSFRNPFSRFSGFGANIIDPVSANDGGFMPSESYFDVAQATINPIFTRLARFKKAITGNIGNACLILLAKPV